jgi:hypothetical protein
MVMRVASRAALAGLILWIGLGAVALAADDAESLFRAGSDLLAANCVDCQGSTRAALARGIEKIEAALAAGYADRVGALKLLADAYGDMSTYAGKTEAAEQFAARQTALRRELYDLAPDDPEVIENYADTLSDGSEKIPLLRRVVAIDPQRNSARYVLGVLLVARNPREGLGLVAESVRRERDPEAVMSYAMSILGVLQEQGCPLADAGRWARDAKAAFDAAMQGEGDPRAMARFKESFAAALDAHRCATP